MIKYFACLDQARLHAFPFNLQLKKDRVIMQVDRIMRGAFLPRRKTVSAKKFYSKKAELAKYFEIKHDLNKESSRKIANELFKAGLSGLPRSRLSRFVAKLLQNVGITEDTSEQERSDETFIRKKEQRTDELVDWVDLIDSEKDLSYETVSRASKSSSSPSGGILKPKMKLPPIQPTVVTLVPKMHIKLPKVSFSLSSSNYSDLTISEGSLMYSDLEDELAQTSSSEEVKKEWRKPKLPIFTFSEESSEQKYTTSLDATWAYTESKVTPSSEYSDRVLTDEEVDIEKRPADFKRKRGPSFMSPFEVADHISNILEAIMDSGKDVKAVIRGALYVLADNPPELERLEKLVKKFNKDTSIFWNDQIKNSKLMNVFKDVVFDTAAVMLEHLEPAKASRLLSQIKVVASDMLDKLAQIGTISLSENDVQRLYDGMAVLNSSAFLDKDLFIHNAPRGPALPGNAQRWLKPLDMNRIFRTSSLSKSSRTASHVSSRLPDVKKSFEKTKKSSDSSAILIADVSHFLLHYHIFLISFICFKMVFLLQ